LAAPVVISHKSRSKANEIGEMKVIGDVVDKNVIIVDDMVDTAGTITKAAEIMMESGARSVRVMATHAILSGPAHDRIRNSSITEMIVTNTVPLKEVNEKITVLSVADLFADTIKSVYNQRSISSNFIF
jgi:ribose-phosphate pyrophosphokinase